MPLVDITQARLISLEWDSASNVGPFYILLAQASLLEAKREVT